MSSNEDIVYLLNKQHKPTVKQLKTTYSYGRGDYKFKNIAIRMYEQMLSESRMSTNISNIVTKHMSGTALSKAKNILINICYEFKQNLDKKDEKQKNKQNNINFEHEYENFIREGYKRPKNKPEFKITQQDIDEWDKI